MYKMENTILKYFSFDYKQILIDEIALEGLEGIGINLLWRRVEHRISAPVTDKLKVRLWNTIINFKKVLFYQLPEPVPHVEIQDRFSIVDDDTGEIRDPDDYLDGPYEYHPIENEYGSCKHYKTRIQIPNIQFKDIPYGKILAEYGDTLVIVATLEERWKALAYHAPMTYLNQLTSIHYCMLELIGRGRENGQMTTGKTNLSKIIKEPKNLFYNRKTLKQLDLVRVVVITQVMGGRGAKSLLLRIKRFHQPSILTMPKVGKIYNVMEYLLAQPDYTERTDVILKKGLITQPQTRRLRKTINIFNFEERYVKPEENSSGKKIKHTTKRRYISLSSKSDESSQSEDESNVPPLKCQYKVGVGLLRQAYERFLDAGVKGLNQVELGQLLGIEFYTSRSICRIFRSRNIVREFLEDKGKQRTARFIAVAAGKTDAKYAEEKKKFLEYLNQSSNSLNISEGQSTSNEATSESAQPNKKVKLESDTNNESAVNENKDITEIKVLDGVENTSLSLLDSKKNLTLRQLKFANGLLKVIGERQCVSGYQTLTNLVSKEIGEPPLVTKALKSFIQKLVTDGHLKIFRVHWPGSSQKYSNFICASNVKATDPVIKSRHKEITLRALSKKKPNIKREITENNVKPFMGFAYPRYMKIQNLHEFLMKFVYFEPIVPELKRLSRGFVSILDLMPEITVKFAISNMSNAGMSDIIHLKIQDNHLNVKLRHAPPDIYEHLLHSKSLINSIRTNLKVLAMLGLVQLTHQPTVHPVDYNTSNLASFVFYVNRHAKILDTTGVWPRKNVNIKTLEKKFNFETLDNVKEYWSIVFDISTSTNIKLAKRDKKTLNPPVRLESEVHMHDDGKRYGDGCGPCGFDSCFYMEIPRLWRTFYTRPANSKSLSKKTVTIKIPKLEANKKQKTNKAKKKVVSKPNSVVAKIKSCDKLRRKRLSDSTVKWTKQEDSIIIMCKAAITIMSPSSQPGCLKVRNLVAKDILSINDPKKTQSACHRRALVLQSNITLTHDKECILNEMRRRRYLIQKYEGLLKKLRLIHSTNMSKFMNEARLPMMELVWIISQLVQSQSYNQRMPCVAMNVEDFHEHFAIVPATANKSYSIYKSPENAALKEAILLTIMLSLDNELGSEAADKAYKVFNAYPENSLRIAVDQLRKCSAISAKEKILNNQMHRINLEDIVQSSYKISMLYQRKWANRLNNEFADNLANLIDADLIQNIKGSAEINCLFLELLASNILELVSTTIPVIIDSSGTSIIQEEQLNVIDIETKYKLKSGSLGWRNKSNTKHFSMLYRNDELEEILESMLKNIIVDPKSGQDLDMKDKIIKRLKKAGEEGATLRDLQKMTGYKNKDLLDRLDDLESRNIIKRVGYHGNKIVLISYIKPWTMNIGDKTIMPTPWLTLESKIRYEIFLRWAGTVMNKIFESPGCSVSYLSDYFEYLSTKGIQDICMFLEKFKCVTLQTMKSQEMDIFSNDDTVPDLDEFNQYESVDDILVFPVKNSITKYAYLRKIIISRYCTEI